MGRKERKWKKVTEVERGNGPEEGRNYDQCHLPVVKNKTWYITFCFLIKFIFLIILDGESRSSEGRGISKLVRELKKLKKKEEKWTLFSSSNA